MIEIAKIVNRIANEQYGILRPMRSKIKWTATYAANSTNALTTNDKYGFISQAPVVIEMGEIE